jgi:hypothetical protein
MLMALHIIFGREMHLAGRNDLASIVQTCLTYGAL